MSTIFTFENIKNAYERCLKNKRSATSSIEFEINRERNLYDLYLELKNRRYEISPYICFVIENPTPREIFASAFRDRIVHHLFCNEIQPHFEKDFLPNSYANRKNKGTHKAVDRLEHLIQKHPESFYIKMDIKSFFRSINKDILYKLVADKIRSISKPLWWQEEMLYLLDKILYCNPTLQYEYRGYASKKKLIAKDKSLFSSDGSAGIPIGNLTSQFFANVYLDALDKYIVRDLGLTNYVRYVDDFVIVGSDGKELKRAEKKVDWFLRQERKLALSPHKTKLQQVYKGIDFLGYVIKPKYRLVRRRVVGRVKLALSTINEENYEDKLPVAVSYWGHFKKAKSYRLRKHLYEKYLASWYNIVND